MNRKRVIYVDVDDTLIRTSGGKRIPIPATIALVQRLFEDGATLYCWSAGGASYARDVAADLNISNCFEGFLPKPDIFIDDLSPDKWGIRQIHPNEIDSFQF